MIFNKYKQFGFSLVEAMIGLGLMTAVGVGVMQLRGQQVKTQKNLDADYEIKMLTSIIYNQLKHDKACFATFDGMDFSGPSEFGVIKNENGDKVFSSTLAAGTAEIFKGKNDIEIVRYLAEPDSMASFSDMGDGTKIGRVRIAIEYRKVNQMLKNDNVYKKYLSLPIRVRLTNSDNHVNNCISGGDEATITALNQFCESLNGVLDESSDPLQPRCQLGGTTDYESGNESYQGFSAAAFQDFMADYAPAVFVLRKDAGSGPAMEGPLNADKNISLTEEPIEGMHAMRKIDFDMRVKCGSGLIGIMTDKGLKCREKFACSNSGDDNQQYLAGIDGDGNPVCNNLIEGVECATGGGTLKVKPDGRVTFDCCSPECSDAGAYCTGQTYESSNGCGLCTGTKPASSATQTWVDTGDVRDTSGCMDGYIQTEKKQISQCSGTSECGGATCTPNEERWVAGKPKACSTCQPAVISILDTRKDAVKFIWKADFVGSYKVELRTSDFKTVLEAKEVVTDSVGNGITDFQGLSASTEYGLHIGYYCDVEGSPGIWTDAVFTTQGETACVEGDHKVGDLYEHTQNTKYCAPYTGDIWTYKRMVCEGGVYRWDGLYLRRTQQACDPETPMPPLESALADVSHTGGLDPCETGESGFDDYKRTTNANGTWNWCQWRFEGGGGCFIAGSQVTMADRRQVNIEDIEVGEKLLTTSGQINTVKKLIRIDYKGLIYSINGSDYFFTPNHPLKTLTGWKSLRPDLTRQEIPNLKVEKLKLGDILIKDNGLEIIMSLDSKYTEQKVYNFEMDGDHEFIVNDIGVHNKL